MLLGRPAEANAGSRQEPEKLLNRGGREGEAEAAAQRRCSALPQYPGDMPASAGRVRMPASNRIHSSAALQTHGIWSQHIGDSYAPESGGAAGGGSEGNMFAVQQGLMNLAKANAVQNTASERGSCKHCGGVGHYSWQCRNHLDAGLTSIDDIDSTSSESSESDDESDSGGGAAAANDRAAALEAKLGGGGSEPKRRRDSDDDADERERDGKKQKKHKKEKKSKKKHKKEKKSKKKHKKEKKSKKSRR